ADTILRPTDVYAQLRAHHAREQADVTLGLFETDRPQKFGMVRLEGGYPVEFVDKPQKTDLRLMWGIGCWGPRFSAFQGEYLAVRYTGREIVLSDVFAAALGAGLKVAAVELAGGRYVDVGTPDELNAILPELAARVSFGG